MFIWDVGHWLLFLLCLSGFGTGAMLAYKMSSKGVHPFQFWGRSLRTGVNSLNVLQNSPVKPFSLGNFFVGRSLIIDSISLPVIDQFVFSLSSGLSLRRGFLGICPFHLGYYFIQYVDIQVLRVLILFFFCLYLLDFFPPKGCHPYSTERVTCDHDSLAGAVSCS